MTAEKYQKIPPIRLVGKPVPVEHQRCLVAVRTRRGFVEVPCLQTCVEGGFYRFIRLWLKYLCDWPALAGAMDWPVYVCLCAMKVLGSCGLCTM